ncbi:MAG: hypothetical protein U9Q81_17285 [Pseudomonadota bacterium]|nr:hypothetical protein [Pseudomonadota bacterium]
MRAEGNSIRPHWACVLLLLAGCATDPPRDSGPPANVTVHREPSSQDSVFPMFFSVDGQPITRLRPGEGSSFELPAGEHAFAYELGLYNCARTIRVSPGGTYVFRLAHGCVIEPDTQE